MDKNRASLSEILQLWQQHKQQQFALPRREFAEWQAIAERSTDRFAQMLFALSSWRQQISSQLGWKRQGHVHAGWERTGSCPRPNSLHSRTGEGRVWSQPQQRGLGASHSGARAGFQSGERNGLEESRRGREGGRGGPSSERNFNFSLTARGGTSGHRTSARRSISRRRR